MGDAMRLARLLDELRGGNRGYQADRDALKKIRATWPQAAEAVRLYDQLAADAAARAVEEGATAVVFGGAGFPGPGDPPHRAAAAAGAAARFYYPDPSGVITILRNRSLSGDSRALALVASVGDPDGLLQDIRKRGAGPGPYVVQWGFAAGFLDGSGAAEAVARYRKLLPSGSQIMIATMDGPAGRRLAMLGGVVPHAPADVAAWLAAAGLDDDRGSELSRTLAGQPNETTFRSTKGRELSPTLCGGEKGAHSVSTLGGRIVAAVARVP